MHALLTIVAAAAVMGAFDPVSAGGDDDGLAPLDDQVAPDGAAACGGQTDDRLEAAIVAVFAAAGRCDAYEPRRYAPYIDSAYFNGLSIADMNDPASYFRFYELDLAVFGLAPPSGACGFPAREDWQRLSQAYLAKTDLCADYTGPRE